MDVTDPTPDCSQTTLGYYSFSLLLVGREVILARNFEHHISDKEDNQSNRVFVGGQIEIYFHPGDFGISDTAKRQRLVSETRSSQDEEIITLTSSGPGRIGDT